MLIRPNNKKGITIIAKKVFLRAQTSLLPLIVHEIKYQPSQKFIHYLIMKTIVGKALFYQSVKKIFSPNMHSNY